MSHSLSDGQLCRARCPVDRIYGHHDALGPDPEIDEALANRSADCCLPAYPPLMPPVLARVFNAGR